jgi:hypothetical protein
MLVKVFIDRIDELATNEGTVKEITVGKGVIAEDLGDEFVGESRRN